MKNIYRVVLISFAFLFAVSAGSFAQKLGHINANDVLSVMPEVDSVKVKMEKLKAELTKNLEDMQVEYNRKADEYQTNQAKWTDLVKKSKEADVVSMQQKISDFQAMATDELQTKEQEFLKPIYDKVLKAIADVAKAQNITYVVNSTALLYVATDAVDLAPAVKTKLGLK